MVERGKKEDDKDSQAIVDQTLGKKVQISKDGKVCHLAFKTQRKEILSASRVGKMF